MTSNTDRDYMATHKVLSREHGGQHRITFADMLKNGGIEDVTFAGRERTTDEVRG